MKAETHNIDPDNLAALPRAPGVYLFHGSGTLPLYIGKSVDIRNRVMSHLRAPDEIRMMSQTRRVDFIETAGEIGALLLESRLIKEQSPLFNQRLRRVKTLCSIQLRQDIDGLKPDIVSSQAVSLGTTAGLYGLFASKNAALGKIKQLAQEHFLCQVLLGLEKQVRRGCFGLQIKTCLGACIGAEPRQKHDARLLAALAGSQVAIWPYAGSIDLIEERTGWVQKHRIYNWCYQGTQCSKANALLGNTPEQSRLALPAFDLDSYKILVKPILQGSVRIELSACAHTDEAR